MRRLLVLALLALFVLPASAFAATNAATKPVTLSGFLFNNTKNAKLTVKLGDSLRFTWKNGVHNVLTSKAPAGAKKVNSGAPVAGHKPIVFKPGKKGTFVFYCQPHKALGMVLTVTVK
jgi:plastocyanin